MAENSSRWLHRLKRLTQGLLVLTLILGAWYIIRRSLLPKPPPPTEQALAFKERVKIVRDEWGVCHVYGKTDADTAFGLAYCHAEDDFPIIQAILAASRGQLSLIKPGKTGLVNDMYVDLFEINKEVDEQYEKVLSKETRAILEAYSEGLNYYAALHPKEADGRIFPTTGKDLAAGFVHKIPFMLGVDKVMGRLFNAEKPLKVGDIIQYARRKPSEMTGSNAHAVGPARSADGKTRLNVNSHQPWYGPVSWHEIHLVSEEGWDCLGANFPGAPMMLVGHNKNLGWGHTVNSPDFVDVYKLEMNPDNEKQYKYDGEWKELKTHEGSIEIDLGLFNYTWKPTLYRSVHGPVMKTDHGYYAIRYAGHGHLIKAAEQWFKMNKARNFDEFIAAMKIQGVPMFNTIYADREQNIYYVYNARLPIRKEGLDWHGILPGDKSELVWTEYLPFEKLPQVKNPKSGFLQNCNSTPFLATIGKDNAIKKNYSKTFGIESRQTNRAMRSFELFGADKSITHDEFVKYKFDRAYSKKSPIMDEAIKPVLTKFEAKTENEKKAVEILRNWDLRTDENSTGATLAVLTYRPLWFALVAKGEGTLPDPLVTFRNAVKFLEKHYGRVDVPLGTVQRLQHGGLDFPIGGGPDILNALHAETRGKHIVGVAGDSYIQIVEFSKDDVRYWSLQPFGNVNRKKSPHYADQAPLFVKRVLRPGLRTKDQIRRHQESEYHPGDEDKPESKSSKK